MGLVEMLEQKDVKELATLYVLRPVFENVLAAWERKRDGNERTRSKMAEELKELPALLRIEIAEGALQMACVWNDECRGRTARVWRDRLDTDLVLKEVLNECFDSMAEVVGVGIHTQFAWRFVWACVRKQATGNLLPERTCLNTIVEYITNDREEKAATEMGAVADVAAGGEQETRIRGLLDAAKEAQVHNLETSLRILTSKFQVHLTTYNLDKVSIDAKMAAMEARVEHYTELQAKVAAMEANMAAKAANMEAMEANMAAKMAAMEARVATLERPWYQTRAKKKSGQGGLGALLGELEKLREADAGGEAGEI